MNDDHAAEIRKLVEDLQAAQSDVEPFLALHTPTAILVNFGGRRVMGSDELGQAMGAALATPLADVTTTAEIDDIRLLRPDIAIVSCTKHIHDGREAASGALPSTGRLTYVVVQEDGAWRVALAQTTPVLGA